MSGFIADLTLVILGATISAGLLSVIVIHLIRKNFYRPKLYLKNIRIVPTKGEINRDKFKWGGLIITGDLCNDSDFWAYSVHIEDIYAEFHPNSRVKLLSKIPLRLATDLPRVDNFEYFERNTQLQNIRPGGKIVSSIRILTKKEISLSDFKLLVRELKMIQLRLKLSYSNAAGFKSSTYFWLDFKYARFINLFGRGLAGNQLLGNGHEELKSRIKIKSKIIEIETEPF